MQIVRGGQLVVVERWKVSKLQMTVRRFDPEQHWRQVLATPKLAPIAYQIAEEYFRRNPFNAPQAKTTESHSAGSGAPAGAAPDEETEAAFAAYLADTAIPESDQPQE